MALLLHVALVADVAAQIPGTLGVSVRNDVMDRIPQPLVFVSQDGTTYGLTGDATGNVTAPLLMLDQPIIVRLEEVLTTDGPGGPPAITVGQHFGFVAREANETSDDVRLVYCQPTARQLTVDFTATQQLRDGSSGWTAVADTTATPPVFDAWIAELPTEEVISNYYAFMTGDFETLWQHGILIRVEQDVDLTGTPITFAIDHDGYSYGTTGPRIGSRYFGNHPNGQGHTAFAAGIDSTHVYVELEGELRTGDNLIFLKEPQPALAQPAPPLSGPVTYPATASAQCTPPAPVCSTAGQCTPRCNGAVEKGDATCADKVELLGNVVCAPCGAEVSKEKCNKWKGGIVAKLTFGFFGGDLELSASGELSGEVCTQVTALEGNCVQGYFCYKVCTRTCLWEHTMHYDPWITFLSGGPQHCKVDGIDAATACEHTDCDE
ncbi:MAG: hypothetical protein DHS20C15_24280 [Planctomycetota bacterium]|nr:MAG: hypothetical protein DHS20C15_24280 [Planctomycetota bacterium]